MTQEARDRHAELLLAAIRAEAIADRIGDREFRRYCLALTTDLDLPEPAKLTVIPGGDAA